MEEEAEYLKLPLEDRCIHKNWRARVHGYEECIKVFPTITDEKSPEFTKFAPLMKKFVTDSNAVAQEKALEAVLVFAENAHIAPRTVTDVSSGIVAKALGGSRRSTLEKAELVLLMYCEIEKYQVVQEELIKGFAAKNPKVVVACVKILTTALREFSHKVISPKPLVKQFSRLLEDRDKNVREEGKKLLVEMYRWIGDALKPQLNSLKPLQITELEAEFSKLAGEKAVQTRFLRSQQELKEKMEAGGGEEEDEEDDADGPAAPEIDPYDLMDPVNILAKLPGDFYEKCEAKKWQERKEAMEILLPHTKNMRLEPGDYHDLMKALRKIIGKDTNVMIVALAAQCVAGLAKGLKKKFSVFAVACIETCLEKFKEKKINVVTSLREAVDAIYQTTSLESMQETVCTALTNKNPNVKAETASFIARCFCYCTPVILNKKMVKIFATDLTKTLNEPDPTVRDNSAEALGTLLKVVGEKMLMPFLGDMDNLKKQKITEASEKAEIKVKLPKGAGASKPKPVASAAKAPAPVKTVKGGGGAKAPSAVVRKPKSAPSSGGGSKKSAPVPTGPPREQEISIEEALERAGEVLGEEVITQVKDVNWKERLQAMETVNEIVSGLDTTAPCQAIVRVIAQKPGLKDNNFQVLKLKLTALQTLAENTKFTSTSCEVILPELIDKLADIKNGSASGNTLMSLAEAVSLEWLAPEVMRIAAEHRSPKVQERALAWLARAITDFGFIVDPKSVINDIKTGLSHTNPGVRNAAIALCGTIHLHFGAIRTFLEEEKPALLAQIDAEIEKQTVELVRMFHQNKGKGAPAPTRRRRSPGGSGGSGGCSPDNTNDDDVANSNVEVPPSVEDLIPRTSIANEITEELIAELGDKNWKTRSEALGKVSSIIKAAKFITADVGELIPALNSRLSDTNKNLATEALRVVGALATAAGSNCTRHTRHILPGILTALGDSKPNVRAVAQEVLDTWCSQVKPAEYIEGEACVDALKNGSVFLKTALFPWLGQHLENTAPKTFAKEDLSNYIPHLLVGLEDRNADVRKAATEAVYPFMLHLGYEGIMKHASRVKPASKNTITAILDKARQNLPSKQTAPPPSTGVRGGAVRPGTAAPASKGRPQTGSSGGGLKKPTGRAATAPPSSSRNKNAEEDTSPLLPVNNSKTQRANDEQKLRVLRWDFSVPRQEFITQLMDQMTNAGVNKTLITNMFHKDFNFHKKSLDALHEDVHHNLEACICNLDMILRWISLRFFDTNPSVIMKAMDYLQIVFTSLAEDRYVLMDFEAYSFLPFIVQKFGDPKDGIRGPARTIVRTICSIYPAGKVSPHLMEGLKTKNARQRAECLEAIGCLIESAGMSVCQPSPSVALKEIAKQISDKDKVVRNAALNALVQVYYKEGEKVYKYVGQLSSKDMSFLEERIKQAAKNRPVIRKPEPVQQPEAPVQAAATPVQGGRMRGVNRVIPAPASQFNPAPRGAVTEATNISETSSDSDINRLLQRYRPRSQVSANSGPSSRPNSAFQLDYKVIENLLSDTADQPAPVDIEPIDDLNSLLNFKAECPRTNTSRLARPHSAYMPSTNSLRNTSIPTNDNEDASSAINMVISQMSSTNTDTVIKALCQLDEVIASSDEQRWRQLIPHVDQLLVVATVQYRLVLNTKISSVNPQDRQDSVKIYRALTNCLMMVFDKPQLAVTASRDVLCDVWHVLLSTLIDPRLNPMEEGPQIIRAFNVLVVRMAEKAHFTNIFSASLKLLHDAVSSGGCTQGNKFGELVLKCNWKIMQMLSKRSNDLDIAVILRDVHHFLVTFPMNTWNGQSAVPLRTIKTVIHTLCKIYGYSVLPHLEAIPDSNGSDLQKYIIKMLKKSDQGDTNTVPQHTSNQNNSCQTVLGASAGQVPSSQGVGKSPKRLSKAANNSLSEIFRKIGSKENTKEGLVELYEFQLLHPEADLAPYLSKSSTFFQNYIERGLKKVRAERELKDNNSTENNSNTVPLSTTTSNNLHNNSTSHTASAASFNMNELVDQFKSIASQAGFDNAYIDTAVKDICTAKEGEKDYQKIISDFTEQNRRD